MAMVQCAEKKHLYDNKKYSSCPYCPVLKGSVGDGGTQARHPAPASSGTVAQGGSGGGGMTISLPPGGTYDPAKPITNPVVGWLVCIEGVNRGRDYRLHNGLNKVGRGAKWDVNVEEDESISSQNVNCAVAYSDRNRRFSISPGEGVNLVYVEGEELLTARTLEAYQRIEIGESVFLFIPFCSDKFQWGEAKPVDKPVSDKPEKVTPRHPSDRGESLG